MVKLRELLSLKQGEVLAVVGCGGKTSIINLLARENTDRGVLIAPTTRIELSECLPIEGVTYFGRKEGEKLVGLGEAQIREASRDCSLTLMEADGSRRLPLKGWAQHEPVIPSFTTLTLGILSANALGLSATMKHVHRLPAFLALTNLTEGDRVDERALERMVFETGGMLHKAMSRRAIVINQAESMQSFHGARRIAQALEGHGVPIFIGSTRTGMFEKWGSV